MEKSPDTYRIFCLGGSTTYGRPYDDETSFVGFLREYLPAIDRSKDWEVINAGGISYASYRVEVLLDELIQYQPDMLVIYTGHNEFLEDRTYQRLLSVPKSVRRFAEYARRLRTVAAMEKLVQPASLDENQQSLSGEVDAILDRSIGPAAYHRDPPWRAEVLANFRSTLERILAKAEEAGVRVLLVVPADNLRDCSPFKSEHSAEITASQQREFMQLFDRGRAALDNGEPDVAVELLERATKMDPSYAAAYYYLGHAYLGVDQVAAAREAFLRARQEDVCPLRAIAEIQQIVREVGNENQVATIDFPSLLESRSEFEIPGADWFLDHVHPTIDGHAFLAENIVDRLADAGIVAPHTGWDASEFASIAGLRKQQIDPQKHAVSLKNLAKVFSWAGKVEEADRLAQQAGEILGDDAESQVMSGVAKLRQNDLDAAQRSFEFALQQEPNNVRALSALADVMYRRGELEQALELFQKAIAIEPQHSPAHFNLGNTFRDLGQIDAAAAEYHAALAITPEHADSHKNLGLLLAGQGAIDEAVSHFENAADLEPRVPQRHADLGYILIDAGQLARAKTEFQAALAIDPNNLSAIFGMGLAQAQSGMREQAEIWLSKVLLIDPQHAGAKSVLQAIRN
ncbi:tetratricopeptide repeat protein [Rosistilla ulvae]|uniref:tetratricopeptide repeat protein n=1 Tax=Rosistilla ulvae TaxID=1930277 RepID=UPI001C54CC6D|nr:tetratricopeptide repeat protein [Rosistilla ulvae]